MLTQDALSYRWLNNTRLYLEGSLPGECREMTDQWDPSGFFLACYTVPWSFIAYSTSLVYSSFTEPIFTPTAPRAYSNEELQLGVCFATQHSAHTVHLVLKAICCVNCFIGATQFTLVKYFSTDIVAQLLPDSKPSMSQSAAFLRLEMHLVSRGHRTWINMSTSFKFARFRRKVP